ncbi:MAG: hypothetical protein QXL96_09080 [Ignisphaera sp.]
MRRSILIGLIIGLLVGFIDSYNYAVSGYTTAEVSLVIIPFLVVMTLKLLRISYSSEDIAMATALTYGICITTTLTSGMYITFGFLDYLSKKLKAYGLAVSVPSYLFSGVFPDYIALAVYVSLALISFSGALIAFSFRSHFIERERLKFPIGFASAMLTKLFDKMTLSYKSVLLALSIGFFFQLLAMYNELFFDLTPLLSSILPGMVLALSFWPIIVGLLFIIPLEPLKIISLGSITTYLFFVPLAIALFNIKVIPALNFSDALFSYSTVVVGLLVGVVVVALVFYLITYTKMLTTSITMIFRLKMERTIFILGISLLSLLGYIAILISNYHGVIFHIIPILTIHVILTIVNLRTVGEAGISSQALLPLVTLYLYLVGVKDVSTYAVLDPYTGIPMPQVVGGSVMNLLRFARFFRCNIVKILTYFGLGIFIGSFTTYMYGNILVHVYGFNSSHMPLARWIPTVVWMATIYSGKLELMPFITILLGVAVGVLLVVLSSRRILPIFPFIVGITLPPDIGIISLIVFLIKKMLVQLGVEVHEKCIVFSTLFIIGCGLAIVIDTFIKLITV